MLGEPSTEVFMRLQLKQQEIYGSIPFKFLPDENKLERSEKARTRKGLVKFALLISHFSSTRRASFLPGQNVHGFDPTSRAVFQRCWI